MIIYRLLITIFFLSPAFLFAQSTPELHLTSDSLAQNGVLPLSDMGNWKYHPGDDHQWADPEYDDSGWISLKPDNLKANDMLDSLWNGFGWWRIALKSDQTFYQQPSYLQFYSWGAAEVFIDGKLFHRYGKFSTLAETEKNHNPFYTKDQLLSLAMRDSVVIAVRYSHHQAKPLYKTFNKRAVPLGFEIGLTDGSRNDLLESDKTYSTISVSVSAAILLLLLLLHLVLYWNYPKDNFNLVISFGISATIALLLLENFFLIFNTTGFG